MSRDHPAIWMWAEACDLLERAERLQRQFFQPASPGRRCAWLAPVDVYETEGEVVVVVALPGVDPAGVDMVCERNALTIAAERGVRLGERALIHRMEIPYGRFERRIELPMDVLELAGHEFVDGCLVLTLRKGR